MSWAVLAKKVEEPKDKREALVSYGSPGHSALSYQAPASLGQADANTISVGAGYSIGGAKPSYSFGQGSSGALQYSAEGLSPLAANSHGNIQLPPITLQPANGGAFSTGDLSQLMSQLSGTLHAGGISLQPSTTVAEFHQGAEGAQQGGQEYAFPQFSYAAPKQQHFVLSEQLQQQLSSAPAYSAGSKGLGSYSTGPVLFTPSESQSNNAPAQQSYGAPSAGHSLGDTGSLSLGGLGGGSHSLSGITLGGTGHSFGGSAHGLGSGLSLGGTGHSFGNSYKHLSGYAGPGKTSFKPSAYLGSSVQGEGQALSSHGLSSLSGSYGSPSFGGFRGAGHGSLTLGSSGHSVSFGGSQGFGSGSSKFLAPVYQSAKGEGLESASAFSSGHVAPPGTTYGFPTSSYSNNAHAASSNKPYYVNAKHHHHAPPSFGEGSSSYRAPGSSHSSLSSFSSGPKYNFGGSSSLYSPKDAYGAASETTYNTIKYSEELKPRAH
uniref:Uncharacterized protein n=1 Tax=Heliothis virescens TaxID=7102 RepID=A0A2A4JFX5_HELVI